jgi:hypothetical protein
MKNSYKEYVIKNEHCEIDTDYCPIKLHIRAEACSYIIFSVQNHKKGKFKFVF